MRPDLRALARAAVMISLATLAACSSTSLPSPTSTDATPDSGPVTITLKGAVAKGPFILGSPVTVNSIDALGNPTGTNFLTETSDALGDFSVTFAYQGPVLLQGSGYYYNEITGTLSSSVLTLDAYADITTTGTHSDYINLVTHLTHDRIQTLLAGGGGTLTVASATAQAESELFAALQIGGTRFNPGASGSQMSSSRGPPRPTDTSSP
jgi:hypothetical protein